MLVGRDADLTELDRAFGEAAAGRPSIVVVSGEAGIGKSRLIAELCARVRAGGGRAVVGGCLDLGEGLPYLPFVEALRGLARSVDKAELDRLLGPARGDFSRVVPELIPPEAVDPGLPAEPPIPPGRLYEGVIGLLGRVGRVAPAVLAIEDVHWIDRSSRDLVTFLVRNLVSERVVMILTARTDDLPPGHPTLEWLAELTRHPRVSRLDLAPLSPAAVADQLEAILGTRPDPETLERVIARSDGNPFFAEELLAAAAAGRPTSPGITSTPPTLAGILAARLARLSSTAQAVLGALAVAGRPVDERLLGEVLSLRPDDLAEPLRELRDGHVVQTEPLHGAFRLRHVLLAEVALDQVLPARRRALHEAFATALTRRPEFADAGRAGADAELAWHWESAGRWQDAYEAAVRAGGWAQGVGAHDAAHAQFERAIALLPRLESPPSPAARVGLLRQAADAADLAGSLARALELATEALAHVDEAEDPETAALLLGRVGYLHWALGDTDQAVVAHRRAVALAPAGSASPTRARLLGSLAGILLGPDGYDEAAVTARDAIEAAAAVGSIPEEARARNVLGSALVGAGQIDDGLDELRRSRVLAERDGPPDVLVVIHHNLALNLAQTGRLDEGLAEAMAGSDAARRSGLERRFGMNLVALAADILLRLGRWAEASELSDGGLALDPTGRGSVYLAAVRGRLDAGRGHLDDAARRLDDADAMGAADDPDLAAYVAIGRGELALAAGRPDDALVTIERAGRELSGVHDAFVRAPLLSLGVRAAADMGERLRAARDPAGVAALAVRVTPIAEELRAIAARMPAQASAALADLAAADLDRLAGTDGGATWVPVIAGLEAVPDPERAARARLSAAAAELRARGTRANPAALLAAAHDTARRLGAEPLRQAIADVARRARVVLEAADAPPRAPDHPAAAPAEPAPADGGVAALRRSGLSVREIEVLQLVAAGRTNGEIADRLFISRKTAGVHVTHILDKLAVSNRVEAAMVAARLGLLPGED